MKRDYSLLRAVIYFAEQKLRETWWLWLYIGILIPVEYMGSELKCPNCGDSGWLEFLLLRVLLLPIVATLIFSMSVLALLAVLLVKDFFPGWIREFLLWIKRNWAQAKVRAKYNSPVEESQSVPGPVVKVKRGRARRSSAGEPK